MPRSEYYQDAGNPVQLSSAARHAPLVGFAAPQRRVEGAMGQRLAALRDLPGDFDCHGRSDALENDSRASDVTGMGHRKHCLDFVVDQQHPARNRDGRFGSSRCDRPAGRRQPADHRDSSP